MWRLFKHCWSTIVIGTPAVIVFFVISGFCIHLPFRGSANIDVSRYYLRRYTRILIPVAAALVVYRVLGTRLTLGGEHSILRESPLWSLACEEIYHALYPILRWIRNGIGWNKTLAGSFVIGSAIALQHSHAESWHDLRPFGTAMIMLPVWLLGCLLAEQGESLQGAVPQFSIWFWRFLAWLDCWISEMMHFKLHVPYTQTDDAVVRGACLLLGAPENQIRKDPTAEPPLGCRRRVELFALPDYWSAIMAVSHLGLDNLNIVQYWFLLLAAGLLISYVFYLFIKRPSHNLARKVKLRGKGPRASQIEDSTPISTTQAAVPEHAAQA